MCLEWCRGEGWVGGDDGRKEMELDFQDVEGYCRGVGFYIEIGIIYGGGEGIGGE